MLSFLEQPFSNKNEFDMTEITKTQGKLDVFNSGTYFY